MCNRIWILKNLTLFNLVLKKKVKAVNTADRYVYLMDWMEDTGKTVATQALSYTVTLNKSCILLYKRIHHKKILLAN